MARFYFMLINLKFMAKFIRYEAAGKLMWDVVMR